METKLGPIVTSTSPTHPETIKIATLTTIVTMILPGTVVIAVVTATTPTMTTIDPETQRYLDPDLVTEETNAMIAMIAMTEMMTCSLMKMTNPFKTLWQHATSLLQTTPLTSNPLF
jgi:hypothetical protein